MLMRRMLLFLKDGQVKSLKEIRENLGVTDRKMQTILRDIRSIEDHHGFKVITEYGLGYRLEIVDNQKLDDFIQEGMEDYSSSRQMRIYYTLFFLLQKKDYIPIHKLSEKLEVSRNTLLRDLDELRRILNANDLQLESKAHYGVRIVGEEDRFRKAFSKFVVNSSYYTLTTQEYFRFTESIDRNELSALIRDVLKDRSFMITQLANDSLVDHVLVLLYRLSLDNHIQSMEIGDTNVGFDLYVDCSQVICAEIEKKYEILVPQIEVQYLASQIAGKTSVETIPLEVKQNLETEIKRILMLIDQENLTEFAQDSTLVNTLLMHMYPLLTRIAFKIELNNPLIELVSSRYANVFLMAVRFIELWDERDAVDLSRDEVGYLALHFASHLERVKQESIDSYRRILLLSEIGRGNVLLMKQKLEQAFPNAFVTISSHLSVQEITDNYPDLVLSSTRLDVEQLTMPVYYIQDILLDEDIQEIKEFMVLHQNAQDPSKDHSGRWMDMLFSEKLFLHTSGSDYLMLIEEMCQRMVNLGKADKSFPTLVLEREMKYTTVYENGIAGPHSMQLNAIEEAIGVIIPEKTLNYLDREVEIIFLINLKKGNLFMYREIGRMLYALTQSPYLVKKIKKVTQFNEFIEMLARFKY